MAAREPAPVLAACGLAFEAALAAGPGVVAVCGPGPARLGEWLEALLDERRGERLAPRCDPWRDVPLDPWRDGRHDAQLDERADARAGARHAAEPTGPVVAGTEDPPPRADPAWAGIISFGCAGALDPDLAPGTCVLATGVQTADGFLSADAAWLCNLARRLPDAVHGELAGLDAPLMTVGGKAALWRSSGACAVDMESHAAARFAQRHGLPFAACRVVLDPAWRGVPPCALAGMRPDGGSAPWPLLRALSAAPDQLGLLGMLACDAWRARRALGRVRARLGARLAAP